MEILLQRAEIPREGKCIFCYSSFFSNHVSYTQGKFRKIDHVYKLYLQPEVYDTSIHSDGSSQNSKYATSTHLCEKCYTSGEKLSMIHVRLKKIQKEMKKFVKQLSNEMVERRNCCTNTIAQNLSGESCLSGETTKYENSSMDENRTPSQDFYEDVTQRTEQDLSCYEEVDYSFEIEPGNISQSDSVLFENRIVTDNNSVASFSGNARKELEVEIVDLTETEDFEIDVSSTKLKSLHIANPTSASGTITNKLELRKLAVSVENTSSKADTSRFSSEVDYPNEENDYSSDENVSRNASADCASNSESDDILCFIRKPRPIKENIPYECQKCGKKFSAAKHYFAHQKYSDCDKSLGVFKCDKCDLKFKANYLFLVHSDLKHEEKTRKNHVCSICSQHFDTNWNSYDLELHYVTHTQEALFSCDICGRPDFLTAKSVRGHRESHRRYVNCSMCDKIFARQTSLNIHKALLHDDGENSTEIICEICGKISKHEIVHKKHLSGHRRKDRKIGVNCKHCSITFANSNALKRHKLEFHSEELYTCEICGKKYLTILSVNNHKNNTHFNQTRKRFVCEICGKSMKSDASLKQHVQRKHSAGHQCSDCGKKFKSNSKLKEHKRTHTGEKLPCTICGLDFTLKYLLRSHQNHAHPELPKYEFKCSICHQIFDSHYKRVSHRNKIHPTPRQIERKKAKVTKIKVKKISKYNNEKKSCKVCGGIFSLSGLRHHLRSCERDKFGSLQCDKCDHKFVKKFSLTYHVKHCHTN